MGDVTVISNDSVWAQLLVANLTARGISATRNSIGGLTGDWFPAATGGWVVIDVDDAPSSWVRAVCGALAKIRTSGTPTVAAIGGLDDLSNLTDADIDARVRKSPDMRVLIRRLLKVMRASPVERAML